MYCRQRRPRSGETSQRERSSLWAATDGASAIEFAVVGAFLSTLILGILDFGMLFFQQMQVATAAQAGANYAMGKAYNSTNVTNAANNATGLTGITVTASTVLCGCPSTTGISSATCGSPCANSAATATGYVKIQTQVNYKTIFPWPGLSNPVTLSGTAYAICQNTSCT